MAIHLEAVYEQSVLRPLEPLGLAEHQRVCVTVEERERPLSWESAQPLDDSRAELDWLAGESRYYTGEWVALDGNRLVAHGPKLAAVKAAAQAAGVSQPFFASVPGDDLSVFEALEKQLGLKLETRKRTMPVIVVDRLEEKPTEN